MADIFISYNQADRDLVRLTAAFLEANGYSVWWDTSLLAGDDFQLKILDEVAKARAVIVIWTPNSVKSTWVRSEAGRAQSDHKLIPLKAVGVTYDEIPPPFNLHHTEDASNRDAVLLSVRAQMGKPTPAPVLIKRARYEILSWVGVIGAAVSLFANLKGAFVLASFVREVVDGWREINRYIWHKLLFFFPPIADVDATALTFIIFAFAALISARQTSSLGSRRPAKQPKVFFVISLMLISLLLSYGLQSSIDRPQSMLVLLNNKIGHVARYDLAERIDWMELNAGIRIGIALTIYLICVLGPYALLIYILRVRGLANVLLIILPFIYYAAMMLMFVVYWEEPIYSWFLPPAFVADIQPLRQFGKYLFGWPIILSLISIGGLLWLAVSPLVGVFSIDVSRLNRRCWRIIAGIALLAGVDFGLLLIESQPWAAELMK